MVELGLHSPMQEHTSAKIDRAGSSIRRARSLPLYQYLSVSIDVLTGMVAGTSNAERGARVCDK